jgi:biotin carboxylase
MSHILIVGRKFSGLTDRLAADGHTYTLLQDILMTKHPLKKLKNRIVSSFASKEEVIESVEMVNSKNHIDGIICIYENYILPTAWITEYLGLPGLSVESAYACTDKLTMRSLFDSAPEKISPQFAEVSNEDEVRKFALFHDFPLILKPANLAKSLLVTKNNSLEELLSNYHKSVALLQTTYSKYAPNRAPKLIVEEFLEGSVHSVDAFIDASGNPHVLDQVVDYQTGYDIGYEDNFHYSRLLPSKLSPDEQIRLRHCAEVGIKALKMKSSPAHVEIIMTKNGPRIVEIGARNGGYRERMHRIANDIDITGAAVDLALGKIPNIAATKNDPCAVLELFPKASGEFIGISHGNELEKLPSLNYLSIKPEIGAYVGKAADGYKMVAVVILSNSNREQFQQDLEFVNNHCHVVTKL